jgi:molybdate-binding protein
MADAGFGVQPAAHQFKLEFLPLAREDYYFAVSVQTLGRPEVQEFLALLRSPGFRDIVGQLPGYECPRAGEVSTLAQVFPSGRGRRTPPPR